MGDPIDAHHRRQILSDWTAHHPHSQREATGTEELKELTTDKTTGETITRELAYGDPSSNAESMAFRRAAARFGLGLYLYDKD